MEKTKQERAIADIDIKRTLFWTLNELDNLIAKETFYSDDVVSSLRLLRNSIEYQMDESKDMGDLPVAIANELVEAFDERLSRKSDQKLVGVRQYLSTETIAFGQKTEREKQKLSKKGGEMLTLICLLLDELEEMNSDTDESQYQALQRCGVARPKTNNERKQYA